MLNAQCLPASYLDSCEKVSNRIGCQIKYALEIEIVSIDIQIHIYYAYADAS